MLKKLFIHLALVGTLLFGAITPAYATAALASAGVQCGSTTIPNGGTSATTTINAVGSGAFIVRDGDTTTQTTTTANTSLTRVELTNTTTVTALRNTSTTTTNTENWCVVDGDTTNLIKSVQKGIINFGTSATGSAVISSVNTSNAVVHYLGQTSTVSGAVATATVWSDVTLTDATHVGAAVGSAPGTNNITVGYEVIEFQSGALNTAVQQISDTASPGTVTRTHSLGTSVTMANSITFYGGQLSGAGPTYANGKQYGELTASGTLTIGTTSAGFVSLTYNTTVVELVSSLVETSAQRGHISIAAGTSGTATLSPTFTSADQLTTFGDNSTSGSNAGTRQGKIAQTSTSQITATFNASSTGAFAWECIGLNPAGAAASPFAGNNKVMSLDGL